MAWACAREAAPIRVAAASQRVSAFMFFIAGSFSFELSFERC
jgi:hypothetical protein